jgi:hypothetical protein
LVIEHDGLLLGIEAPSAAPPETERAIAVTLAGAGPDAEVVAELVVNGSRTGTLTARRAEDGTGNGFVVALPPFAAGHRVDLTIVATSEKRRVPNAGDEDLARLAFEIERPLVRAPAPEPVTVEDLLPDRERAAARGLVDRLAERGIANQADLLAAGMVVFTDLTADERRMLHDLTAHAALGLVAEPAKRRRLIAASLDSPAAIAAEPLAALEARLAPAIDRARVQELHRVASAQVAFLNSFAAGAEATASAPGSPARRCGCEDCEAATSVVIR